MRRFLFLCFFFLNRNNETNFYTITFSVIWWFISNLKVQLPNQLFESSYHWLCFVAKKSECVYRLRTWLDWRHALLIARIFIPFIIYHPLVVSHVRNLNSVRSLAWANNKYNFCAQKSERIKNHWLKDRQEHINFASLLQVASSNRRQKITGVIRSHLCSIITLECNPPSLHKAKQLNVEDETSKRVEVNLFFQ